MTLVSRHFLTNYPPMLLYLRAYLELLAIKKKYQACITTCHESCLGQDEFTSFNATMYLSLEKSNISKLINVMMVAKIEVVLQFLQQISAKIVIK